MVTRTQPPENLVGCTDRHTLRDARRTYVSSERSRRILFIRLRGWKLLIVGAGRHVRGKAGQFERRLKGATRFTQLLGDRPRIEGSQRRRVVQAQKLGALDHAAEYAVEERGVCPGAPRTQGRPLAVARVGRAAVLVTLTPLNSRLSAASESHPPPLSVSQPDSGKNSESALYGCCFVRTGIGGSFQCSVRRKRAGAAGSLPSMRVRQWRTSRQWLPQVSTNWSMPTGWVGMGPNWEKSPAQRCTFPNMPTTSQHDSGTCQHKPGHAGTFLHDRGTAFTEAQAIV